MAWRGCFDVVFGRSFGENSIKFFAPGIIINTTTIYTRVFVWYTLRKYRKMYGERPLPTTKCAGGLE